MQAVYYPTPISVPYFALSVIEKTTHMVANVLMNELNSFRK
jgi:hypothetical protein